MKHVNGTDYCPRCETFLELAHPRIVIWYRGVKKQFPDTHVCESFRNQEDQERDFACKHSEKHWPDSKHNKCFPSGTPASEALDLFRIDENGVASFPWRFYELIWDWSHDEPITWGGTWKTLKDGPHFELDLSKDVQKGGVVG